MKCQILFSGKNKKNNIILSSAENAQRVVKVNFIFSVFPLVLRTRCRFDCISSGVDLFSL